MDKKTGLHIAGEVVIGGAAFLYLMNRISTLENRVTELEKDCQCVAKRQAKLEKAHNHNISKIQDKVEKAERIAVEAKNHQIQPQQQIHRPQLPPTQQTFVHQQRPQVHQPAQPAHIAQNPARRPTNNIPQRPVHQPPVTPQNTHKPKSKKISIEEEFDDPTEPEQEEEEVEEMEEVESEDEEKEESDNEDDMEEEEEQQSTKKGKKVTFKPKPKAATDRAAEMKRRASMTTEE